MNNKGITSFRKVFITFALLAVLVFSMLNFIVTIQETNGVNTDDTILQDDVINSTFNRLETNLTIFRDEAQTQKGAYDQEVPERGFGSLIIFAIVGVGQQFTSMIVAIFNILVILPSSILGVPKIVTGILSAILVLSLILLAWRVYRVGS